MKIYSETERRNFILEQLKKLEHKLGIELRAIVYKAKHQGPFQTRGIECDQDASGIYFENINGGDDELYLVKVFNAELGEIKNAFAAAAVLDADDAFEKSESQSKPLDAAAQAAAWLAKN